MAVTMTGVAGALTPAPTKSTLSTNYLGSSIEFTSQYLPEVYEKEFEKYGIDPEVVVKYHDNCKMRLMDEMESGVV